MADQIAPTRSNLLQRRDQLRLAIRGADLLKRKRDALISEFFDLVKVSLQARRQLGATSKEAYFSLFLAKAWDGPEAVESLSLAQQGELEIDIKIQNLFGVKVPEVQPPEFSDELPFSPVNTGAKTLDAAAEFKRLTEALVQVAATETRLRRIGEEIKKTSRRVNALEQLVIPGINGQIKDIRSVLDQRALEEVTVLKRIKAKLEARAAEEAENAAEAYPANDDGTGKTAKRVETKAKALAPEQNDADKKAKKEPVAAAATAPKAKAKSASSATEPEVPTDAKAETPKGETPKAEASKAEPPKAESPKAETKKPEPKSAEADKKVSKPDVKAPEVAKAETKTETKGAKSEAEANKPADTSSSKKDTPEPSKAATKAAEAKSDKKPAEGKNDSSPKPVDMAPFLEDVKTYSDNVDENAVKAIVNSFKSQLKNRDAMTVACSQQKELNFIKKKYLKGRLNLSETNKVLDKAMDDVCNQMGKANRNKSRVTFYYLLAEKFDKLSAWK